MDIDRVRELVKLVEDSEINELEVTDEGQTIRIQKHAAAAAYAAPPPPPAPAAGSGAMVDAAGPAVDPVRAGWREVRSPIVGTFYHAPSPESPPFVSVGDRIAPGQTLCIVEAMKVMNEIEADFAGVVREIVAVNGTPVEAEGVLFLVEPA